MITIYEQPNEIDSILENQEIHDELSTIFRTISMLRIYHDYEPETPQLEHLSIYKTAVYHLEGQSIHTGDWDAMHFWIAEREGLVSYNEPSTKQVYISCEIFGFKISPGITIVRLDTLTGFSIRHLETLQEQGYTVMGPEYEWLTVDNPQEYNGLTGVGMRTSKLHR